MKVTLFIVVLSLLPIHLSAQSPARARKHPAPKRYFGLHFDFHAGRNDSLIGRNLSERGLDSLLTAVKPDFIQIDCKGHPGVSSYPSKVANATVAPHVVKDPLAFYRAVTRRHGVGLYLHYSGVYDDAVLAKHPGWAAVKADGSMNMSKASVHGPYVDSLLIPQLNELADYGADGVWVDGECWATVPDYSPAALAKFRAETGGKRCHGRRKTLAMGHSTSLPGGRSSGTSGSMSMRYIATSPRSGLRQTGPIRP